MNTIGCSPTYYILGHIEKWNSTAPFSRRSFAHQRPVTTVFRQGFSIPKIDWYDQSITHETSPRPLRGMQQQASEQAGATNGAMYRARKSYNGEFSVNLSAVKTRWVEF